MKAIEKLREIYTKIPKNVKMIVVLAIFVIPMTIFLIKFLGVIRVMKEISEHNSIEIPILPLITWTSLFVITAILVSVTFIYMIAEMYFKKSSEEEIGNIPTSEEDLDNLYANMSIEEINDRMDALQREMDELTEDTEAVEENHEFEDEHPEQIPIPVKPKKTTKKGKKGTKAKEQFNPKAMPL